MKRLLIVIAFCGLAASNSFAQDSNNELLKKLVEKNILTQAEADELSTEQDKKEEKTSLAGSVKKIREAFNTPYMRFGGYGLLWYRYNQYENTHHDVSTRLLFGSMSGNLTDHFRYFVLMEFSDPKLFEFYGEWMPSDAFKLRAGQYKVPFALENPISPTNLETILNTRSVSNLVGMIGDPIQWSKRDGSRENNGGRDMGVQLSGSLFKTGDHHLLHYAGGVFLGTGLNVSENNNTKDFAGNIALQPIKEVRIAAGLYAGKAVYEQIPESGEYGDHGRNRWSIGSEYDSDRLYARAEWIHGNDGGIKKEGLYGTGLYYVIPKKLNFVGKVDYFNQDKSINSEVVDYTVGVNYYFWTQCRFQLNYVYSDYSRNFNERSSENAVQVQMQIVW